MLQVLRQLYLPRHLLSKGDIFKHKKATYLVCGNQTVSQGIGYGDTYTRIVCRLLAADGKVVLTAKPVELLIFVDNKEAPMEIVGHDLKQANLHGQHLAKFVDLSR